MQWEERLNNIANQGNGSYHRYHIETRTVPDIVKWPTRFTVKVCKIGLAKELLSEILHHGIKHREVVTSRPCLYGVFSGPVGGFSPRPEHCVGCLRCTTEYPDFVTVSPNPERNRLGDRFFTSNHINSISYEVESGMIPVKGAGYRGKFGGPGWDGMWTDMSEIVRPTRDGIHGREYISTDVDIGYRPNFLKFDPDGSPIGSTPRVISIPLPMFFDKPPASINSSLFTNILIQAAREAGSLAVLPLGVILKQDLESDHTIPLVRPGEQDGLELLSTTPLLVEMDGWDAHLHEHIKSLFPETLICLRIPFSGSSELLAYHKMGIYVFHLLADYHGRDPMGNFILDGIRQAHKAFVDAGVRQEVTLLASGGMIAAEHIPKALICGLDAVGLDTPILVALQAKFSGECADRESSRFELPGNLELEWGVQRLMNLLASWRDQLLEISGAMGLREIRRMRGEMGRAMFMHELEKEAFAGILDYEVD
jgi:hypothetical protein